MNYKRIQIQTVFILFFVFCSSPILWAESKNETVQKKVCPSESFIELKDNNLSPVFKKGQTLKIQKNFENCGIKLHKSTYVVLKSKKPNETPQVLKIYGRSLDRILIKNQNFLVNQLYSRYEDGEFIKTLNNKFDFKKIVGIKKYGAVIPKNKFLLFNELRKAPYFDSRDLGLYDKSEIEAVVLRKK